MRTMNRAEILIRRYVYDNECKIKPKIRFVIRRAFDTLASGYFEDGNNVELAEEVKKANIHYPTEQEIEEKRLADEKARIARISRNSKKGSKKTAKPYSDPSKTKAKITIGAKEFFEFLDKNGIGKKVLEVGDQNGAFETSNKKKKSEEKK